MNHGNTDLIIGNVGLIFSNDYHFHISEFKTAKNDRIFPSSSSSLHVLPTFLTQRNPHPKPIILSLTYSKHQTQNKRGFYNNNVLAQSYSILAPLFWIFNID